MDFLLVGLGLAALFGGAEFLVRGAVSLARRLGVPPLMIGMTVVALATSAPEIVVSLDAVLLGASALMVGNLIGSNIANALLVLGLTALFAPIVVARRSLSTDTLFYCLATAAAVGFTFWGGVNRWAAGGLLVLYVTQFAVAYRRESRAEGACEVHRHSAEDTVPLPRSPALSALLALGGLAGILAGAEMVVTGAVEVAGRLGMSEEIIGLTIVAIGTSLPEIAASTVAAYRGHTDVAVGNVVGSNLLNLSAIAGVAGLVAPYEIPDHIRDFDVWVLVVASLAIVPALLGRIRLGRRWGLALLGGYGLYLAATVFLPVATSGP